MSGWIKIYRKIMENPLYFSEPFNRSLAWIDMLLLANHADSFFFKRGVKVEVKRGQIGYDLDSLAKRWKWSRGKVERFVKFLENDNQIVRQKTNVTTLISIVNYKEYQKDDKADSKTNSKADSKSDSKPNNKADGNKQECKELKEEKELKECKEYNTVDYEFYFNLFWDAYDKKYGKSKSFEKFKKIKPELYDLIIDKATEYKKSTPDIQFRKNPLTWLNGQHWEDEIVINKTKNNETGSKSDQYMDALFNLANRYKNS
ncbi:phage protein [uncultured phage]|nr:phage protein [uncultured phage]CAD8327875.1 phage protein [uncultured phage]